MLSRPGKITPSPPPEVTKVKVALVGEQQVGKTSFCEVMTGKDFPTEHRPTIGSDYYMKTMKTIKGQF